MYSKCVICGKRIWSKFGRKYCDSRCMNKASKRRRKQTKLKEKNK